jgi:uncharacterized membrane protein YagU involved in acid resistance
MSAPSTALSHRTSNAFLAIFWGGLACGVFDISQACLAWGIQNGAPPVRIFQSVAAGLLGRAAFDGGGKTAALGLALHFFIAFSAATVYYLASRKIRFLTERAVIAGLLYGEAVWLFMSFVVIPLSAIGQRGPMTMAAFWTGPIGHMFLVGLPISLAVRRYSK